ncbi:hypothetical protein FKM82_003864 [Ascaphus truei]
MLEEYFVNIFLFNDLPHVLMSNEGFIPKHIHSKAKKPTNAEKPQNLLPSSATCPTLTKLQLRILGNNGQMRIRKGLYVKHR